MEINCYPVTYEAVDKKTGEVVFKVDCMDDCCATVTILSAVDRVLWAAVAREVDKCLRAMFPEQVNETQDTLDRLFTGKEVE